MTGLTWAGHKLFYLSWTLCATGVGIALYAQSQDREAVYQKRRKAWMHAGHYKHPWENPNQPFNDPLAIEKLKGRDYVEFSKFPSGI